MANEREPRNAGSAEDFENEVVPYLRAQAAAAYPEQNGVDPTILAMSAKITPETVAAIHDAIPPKPTIKNAPAHE